MYISCIFFKEFLYFKKLPNLVQTLSYFLLLHKLLSPEQQSTCLTLLMLLVTNWLIDTKSLYSRNLLCSDNLEHSRKSFPIITERWNGPENTPQNLPQAISSGWDSLGPEVQGVCCITLGVSLLVAWTLACIYDPGFKYLETIDLKNINL